MADMLSPGVELNEVDYSDYVASASTCSIGITGGARRGPVGVPTLITSQENAIKTFGAPVENDFGMYAALAALAQADMVYYTRVVRSDVAATAGVNGVDKVIYSSAVRGSSANGTVVEQTALSGDTFTVTVKVDGETKETFENLSLEKSSTGYAPIKINGVSEYISVEVQSTGSVAEKTFTLTGGYNTGAYSHAGNAETDSLTFRSKYFDSDINGCKVYISAKGVSGYFDISLRDTVGETIEAFNNLSTEETSDRYVGTYINAHSTRLVCSYDSSKEFAATSVTFSGGEDGIEGITKYDIIKTGLQSFSNPETLDINILCAPGWSDVEVINEGIALCASRADSLFIADPPFGMSAQNMVDFTNGSGNYDHAAFDSSYGAIYWPWVKIADSYTRKTRWMPPSGYVVAQYAYNDSVANPWNAPAGLNRGVMAKPIGLETSPTPGERDMVYGNRNVVNPIVNFLGNGIVIWGQKTMQRKPTALDRVNVRRLMNYLKKTIGLSTKYFVFEQNDEATWNRWIDMVEPTLREIQSLHGISDYQIEINPSADDIENNRMPVTVKIKPTKAAEFIPLSFMVEPGTAVFDDSI